MNENISARIRGVINGDKRRNAADYNQLLGEDIRRLFSEYLDGVHSVKVNTMFLATGEYDITVTAKAEREKR